jgi:hypothetical protein
MDALIEAQHKDILNRLQSGAIYSGTGLRQTYTLARPRDTISLQENVNLPAAICGHKVE